MVDELVDLGLTGKDQIKGFNACTVVGAVLGRWSTNRTVDKGF
jgi:hypothetical protein